MSYKQVCLNAGGDSSESSELSSEESAARAGPPQDPLQPALTGTGPVNSDEEEENEPPGTEEPSPATLNTTALPELEDPQTSTDTLQLLPEDPSQTALGIDVSQDMPNSDPAQHPVNADTVLGLPEVLLHQGQAQIDLNIGVQGTNQPQITTTTTTRYQGFPKGDTPPFPTHIIKGAPPPFSKATPMPIPIGTALNGVPVCFTFQFATSEPEPPRGDSM